MNQSWASISGLTGTKPHGTKPHAGQGSDGEESKLNGIHTRPRGAHSAVEETGG